LPAKEDTLMNSVVRFLILCATALFLSTPLFAQLPVLYKNTSLQGDAKERPDPAVTRSRNVVVDLALLRDRQRTVVSAPLFDRRTLVLNRESLETRDNKALVWKGSIANQPGSVVTFVIVNNVVIGNIVSGDNKMFQIRYIGNRVHSLREIDQTKFPNEAKPLEAVPRSRAGVPFPAPDTCTTDPPTDIDTMVVYTDDARTAAGGTDAMVATVYLAAEETNQSYINSDIDQRMRLVHVAEVSYAESGDLFADLPALQGGSIGSVTTLRNTFAADVVSMIVENAGGFCGLGYMNETNTNAFENSAYNVVGRSCATGYYSFGHEFGHNMGADHDPPNATSTGPFPYNRGHSNTSPTAPATPWRTIMSYNTSPSSTRVQFWSNPDVNFTVGGDAMGIADARDNHRVLNNTALSVANFRCSSPGVANVWMKDTWNDTGVEPNPNTAGEAMWQSPYIWIRNTQDTGLTHQHEHQNPEFGSTNWVYVKVHNGATTAQTGNLEVYFAQAATGLSWPGDWTLLSSIPISGFAASSTRIVEAQWTGLPATGHFCMIARWVSAADPMAAAETADINANTLSNNNIVWRNLNVVDLVSPDMAGDASFIVRNTRRERGTISLKITSPTRRGGKSFLNNGQLIVSFDDKLFDLIRKTFKPQRGVKLVGKNFVVAGPQGVAFDAITLPAGYEARARVSFRRNRTAPRRRFEVVVTQYEGGSGRPGKVVGGVSYQLFPHKQ